MRTSRVSLLDTVASVSVSGRRDWFLFSDAQHERDCCLAPQRRGLQRLEHESVQLGLIVNCSIVPIDTFLLRVASFDLLRVSCIFGLFAAPMNLQLFCVLLAFLSRFK